ncbi:hypothetical protein EJB05_24027, partial [Eragrostis curvula]
MQLRMAAASSCVHEPDAQRRVATATRRQPGCNGRASSIGEWGPHLRTTVGNPRWIPDHARPVASRNGRLVLELRRESHADGVRLCVCNPMTGDMEAVLPELSGDDMPGYYACALLIGDDDLTQHHHPTFFRLLLVYNRRGFTALRCYSSDDGRWGPEVRKAGDKIPGEKLRRLAPAVVVRGVAYWALSHGAFGVRLTTRELESSAVRFLGYPRDPYTDTRLLTVSPEEGRLSFVTTRPCGGMFCMQVYVFRGGDDDTAGEWEHSGPPKVCFPQLHVTDPLDIKMRFFCEKSGVVFFALGRCSRTPGTYALRACLVGLQILKETDSAVDSDAK